MENTGLLHQSLLTVLDQGQWQDRRHLKTALDLIVGLILSGTVSLTKWIPYARGRAWFAQSTQRRFIRWLSNQHIHVNQLYAPLIREALSAWGTEPIYLALDTSMLWEQYCLIRVSVVYRGRAIPVAWEVIEHGSSTVAFAVYRRVLERVPALLPKRARKVVLLADRGFADVALMKRCGRLGWSFRIRIKGNFIVYRAGHGKSSVTALAPTSPGQARFFHNVQLTNQRYGPVHLALGCAPDSDQPWLIVSDEPTSQQTFEQYGFRFSIEENFLDDKSNGFQLESSWVRSPEALHRLCFTLAVGTLYLTAQGTQVVAEGHRRWVDAHWFRGNSYFRIGWEWIKHALSKGWELLTSWRLTGGADPEPAIASRRQDNKRRQKLDGFGFNALIYNE